MGWFGAWFGGVSSADTTPPNAPSLVTKSVTTTTITVTVSVPAADHNETVVRYGSANSATVLGSSTVSADGDVTFSGLTAGSTYWVIAFSSDVAGNYSTPSNAVFLTTSGTGVVLDAFDTDISGVFLETDEFAATVTYTFEDGTTRAIKAVFVEMVGALDAVQQGIFYVSDDPANGVVSPVRGEKITNSDGVWTVIDSKEDLGMHAVKCVLPIERN